MILTIVGMSLVTYLPRLIPILTLSERRPRKLEKWLKHIPPAAFSSIVSANILSTAVNNPVTAVKITAAIISLMVALKTGKLATTMLAGLLAYVILSLLFHLI